MKGFFRQICSTIFRNCNPSNFQNLNYIPEFLISIKRHINQYSFVNFSIVILKDTENEEPITIKYNFFDVNLSIKIITRFNTFSGYILKFVVEDN